GPALADQHQTGAGGDERRGTAREVRGAAAATGLGEVRVTRLGLLAAGAALGPLALGAVASGAAAGVLTAGLLTTGAARVLAAAVTAGGALARVTGRGALGLHQRDAALDLGHVQLAGVDGDVEPQGGTGRGVRGGLG